MFCAFSPWPRCTRLGESKEEIAKRYGEAKPIESSFAQCERFQYSSGGFEVMVYFHEGKSVHERIRMADRKLTELEIEDLLRKTNANGHHWIVRTYNDKKKTKYWVRDDKKAEAHREGLQGKWIVIQDTETLKSCCQVLRPPRNSLQKTNLKLT